MTPPEQAPAPLPPTATPASTSPVTDSAASSAAATATGQTVPANRNNAWVWTSVVLGVAATVAVVSSVMLWQRLNNIQQQLALQSADSRGQAVEARTLARQAEDASRDTASRMSVLEARVGEVALQRGQLEELMRSLSRSRDDNLVGDIEGAIRFASQQTQPRIPELFSAKSASPRSLSIPRLYYSRPPIAIRAAQIDPPIMIDHFYAQSRLRGLMDRRCFARGAAARRITSPRPQNI